MENMSLVIPVHNEEESCLSLAQEIETCFQMSEFQWEVIWVNDASRDSTANVLNSFAQKHSHHKVIHLNVQSGQSAAVLTGIMSSRFPLLATLDGDGQNSPFDLLNLKKLLEENKVLLAQGVRVKRKDSGIRLFSTGTANMVRNFLLGVELQDVGCAVRVFRREALYGFPAFKGWHRFLPVMISLLHPGKVIEHPVSHRARIAGVSKYGIWNRLWVGIFDLFGILWFKKRGFSIPAGHIS